MFLSRCCLERFTHAHTCTRTHPTRIVLDPTWSPIFFAREPEVRGKTMFPFTSSNSFVLLLAMKRNEENQNDREIRRIGNGEKRREKIESGRSKVSFVGGSRPELDREITRTTSLYFLKSQSFAVVARLITSDLRYKRVYGTKRSTSQKEVREDGEESDLPIARFAAIRGGLRTIHGR